MLDVAKRANVALSTVSYVLNGTRPISEETRQRVLAAMEELGYKPHALARGLASKRSRLIALLFPASERGLGITELEFVTSAADAAREHGHHLVLWSDSMQEADELRQSLKQGLVDGVLMMEVHLDDPRIRMLREAGIPFSMVGRSSEQDDEFFADIDFEQTIADSVAYLRGLGHTTIALVNHSEAEYERGYGPAVRVQAAFRATMAAAGLASPSVLCHASPQAGYQACVRLLAEQPHVSALAVMNERAIPGIMQALGERGLRVPEHVSLLALVSSGRVAEMMVPPLTAMEAPGSALGRLGVQLLIAQLEAQDGPQLHTLLPCRLVLRGSCAAFQAR